MPKSSSGPDVAGCETPDTRQVADLALDDLVGLFAPIDIVNRWTRMQVEEPQGVGPVGALLDARFHATIARDDVQGAIRRVGRVEHYDLAADFE